MKTTTKHVGLKEGGRYVDVPIADAHDNMMRKRLICFCEGHEVRVPQELVLELARDGAKKTKDLRNKEREILKLRAEINYLNGKVRQLQASIGQPHGNWPD